MDSRQQKYDERYRKEWEPSVANLLEKGALPVYHFVSGFSHPALPIIREEGILLAEWGLIPSWTKDNQTALEIRTKTLNAVGETVFEKASYRKPILTQRCILPIAGFFEWRAYNGKKYPYFIHASDQNILSVACIYDNWIDKTSGEIKTTFSMLTTPANHLMEKIHNLKKRMPLLLSTEHEEIWLQTATKIETISELIRPYEDGKLAAYTLSQTLGNSRLERNTAESLQRVEYAELFDL